MKNIRSMITSRCDDLNSHWQKLPSGKQKKWVILFFAGYLLITGCVVANVWYDAHKASVTEKPPIDHIRNPVLNKEKSGSPAKEPSTVKPKEKGHGRQ